MHAGSWSDRFFLKKFTTAEYISGRLPYGMTSKMIQAIDWKILECNKLLKFDDVGEENFESVVRDLLCELVSCQVITWPMSLDSLQTLAQN